MCIVSGIQFNDIWCPVIPSIGSWPKSIRRTKRRDQARNGLWPAVSDTVQKLGKWCVHGDFGTSTRYKMQVWDLMELRIPYSLKLCGWSLILEIAIALPLGLLCAVKKDKFFDRFTVNSSLLFDSCPGFLAGSLVYPAVCGRTTMAADQRLYFRPKLCASNRNNRPFRYGRHLAYYEKQRCWKY